MRVSTGSVVGLLLVLALLSSSCGQEAGGTDALDRTPPGPALALDFDAGRFGEVLTRLGNDGSGAVDLEVVSAALGKIKVVDGPDGSRAVRFPAHTDVPHPPEAVIVAREGSSEDPSGRALSPGSRNFTFGATFSLDAASDGTVTDNGDNLLQRGSYEDPGQFKLQLDGHRPSCRILGDEGDILVEADAHVTPGEWYTVTCTRSASEVVLTLAPYGSTGRDQTWRKVGVTGAIELGDLPLSVGGKVGADGSPRTSTDQFSGMVDDVFLRMD